MRTANRRSAVAMQAAEYRDFALTKNRIGIKHQKGRCVTENYIAAWSPVISVRFWPVGYLRGATQPDGFWEMKSNYSNTNFITIHS
jgi:hypothetical protein